MHEEWDTSCAGAEVEDAKELVGDSRGLGEFWYVGGQMRRD